MIEVLCCHCSGRDSQSVVVFPQARLKEIGKLDQWLQTAVREGDPQAMQAVCATQWSLCLPLLQHNLRKRIKTPLLSMARVLEDMQRFTVSSDSLSHMVMCESLRAFQLVFYCGVFTITELIFGLIYKTIDQPYCNSTCTSKVALFCRCSILYSIAPCDCSIITQLVLKCNNVHFW